VSDQIDCEQALILLYQFIDGELTTERREWITGHLHGCTHCFSAFDFEQELRMVVRSRLQTPMPEGLRGRIMDALQREFPGLGGGVPGLP